MASGSQLNRWGTNGGELLLSLTPSATAVATPLANYGTIGVNDSGAFITPIGLSKVTFQIIGPGATAAGYTVSVYGTIDPTAYFAYTANSANDGITAGTAKNTTQANYGVVYTIPATSWQLLPAPSEQSGAGVVANPMVTGTSTFMQVSGAFVAYRVVLTTIGVPTLTAAVYGFGIP